MVEWWYETDRNPSIEGDMSNVEEKVKDIIVEELGVERES